MATAMVCLGEDLFHTIELRGECSGLFTLGNRASACDAVPEYQRHVHRCRLCPSLIEVTTYLIETEVPVAPTMLDALEPAILEVRNTTS